MSISDKALRDIICGEIDEKGSVTLDRFIDICLYNPKYGYYNKELIIGSLMDELSLSRAGAN